LQVCPELVEYAAVPFDAEIATNLPLPYFTFAQVSAVGRL
jgi:hypothetical protein